MKTGIEILQEMNERLELLERRFVLIEQNTKEILNKLNIQKTSVVEKKEEVIRPTITSSVPMPTENAVEAQSGQTTRVMSKIKTKDDKMLAGVLVKIYKQDVLVRETKTNRAGEWQCFLAPGSYRVDYFLEGILNTSSFFSVTSDQQILRVPQPEVK